jgi:predicted small lipoprotein YifL
LIESIFSTKLKIDRYFTFISSRTIYPTGGGQVVVKGADMTTAKRIRMRMTAGSRLGFLAGLIFLFLSLAGCGQNGNDHLKSVNQPADANNNSGNHTASSQPQAQTSRMVPDEVLVKFTPDSQPQTIAGIQAELQLETVRQFHSPNLFLMKITDGTAVEAIIRKLKTYPAVQYAEPNYVVKANP